MMDPRREIFQEPTLLPPVGVKRPSARDWSSSSKKKAKMEAGGPSGSNPGSDGSAWSSSSQEKAKRAAGGRSGSHGISDPSAARSSAWKKEVKREAGGPPGANQVSEGSTWSSSSRKKAKIEEAAAGPSGSNARSDRSNGALPWKAVSGSSPCNFSVLAKIVSAMRTRHRRGDTQPLTLEEILADTQQLGIGLEQKQWLMREALVSNPQIQVLHGKYAFKPKYNLENKKALLRLLEEHNRDGLGGILLEDIEEGLPNCQKVLKALGDQIVMVNRSDKKKIIFLNDKSCQFSVDKEFQKVWRSVAVGSLDEEKMEDYLKTQGFSLMQGCGPQKAPSVKGWRKPTSRRKSSVVRHNANLAGVLKDYSDTDLSQEGTNTWSLNQQLQTP